MIQAFYPAPKTDNASPSKPIVRPPFDYMPKSLRETVEDLIKPDDDE